MISREITRPPAPEVPRLRPSPVANHPTRGSGSFPEPRWLTVLATIKHANRLAFKPK